MNWRLLKTEEDFEKFKADVYRVAATDDTVSIGNPKQYPCLTMRCEEPDPSLGSVTIAHYVYHDDIMPLVEARLPEMLDKLRPQLPVMLKQLAGLLKAARQDKDGNGPSGDAGKAGDP